jgi:hypothetical protein
MVVAGEFVIYLDIYDDLTGTLQQILRDMMNKDMALDSVHPLIEKVRYVDLRTESIPGNEKEVDAGTQSRGNNSTLAGSVYAMLAAGAFLVVGTAIFYRRRRHAEQDAGVSTAFDSGTEAQQPHLLD